MDSGDFKLMGKVININFKRQKGILMRPMVVIANENENFKAIIVIPKGAYIEFRFQEDDPHETTSEDIDEAARIAQEYSE